MDRASFTSISQVSGTRAFRTWIKSASAKLEPGDIAILDSLWRTKREEAKACPSSATPSFQFGVPYPPDCFAPQFRIDS